MFRIQSDTTLPKDFQDFILRMAYVAEIKEWDNRAHLERIRRACYLVASGLNLPQQEVETIAYASQLHDVGKINIPEDLVKKTGRYETFEWGIIEKHTTDGARILSGSSSSILMLAEQIAISHHERWDGTGYPHGLRGPEIPLGGRICAVADVFDALTTPRLYKQPMGAQEALKLIKESSGKLFDPEIVKVFEKRIGDLERSMLNS